MGNLYSLADDIFITCLIVINVAAFIASTSPTLSQEQKLILENIEIVSSDGVTTPSKPLAEAG
ncbi:MULTISPECIES: hypothetical protein [unclassified Microcoleus]|uniref:hypothetical protein n=1 Tax=unclassified Microcoleus TaxID=2642155 RepID=UPI002FD12449